MKYFFSLLAVASLFLLAPVCFAQEQTLSVTPSIVRLDLSTDQPQAEIFYTNNSRNVVELSFEAQDFTQLEDGYKLSFLDQKNAQNYKYRLSSWVYFSSQNLILNPGEKESVTVFINKDRLTPGGHYSTILAHIATKQNNAGTITLQSTLASLLFVRTNSGVENEDGTLPTFTVIQDSIFLPFPSSVFFRLNNQGDVDIVPYGLIQIKDSHGQIVAKGIVNENSLSTLPESIRRYDTPIKTLVPFVFPGWYSATLSLHYGKSNKRLSSTTTFFTEGTIPFGEILLTGGILFLFGWYIKRRLFRKNSH